MSEKFTNCKTGKSIEERLSIIEKRLTGIERDENGILSKLAENDSHDSDVDEQLNAIWEILAPCDDECEEEDEELTPEEDMAAYAYHNYELNSYIITGGKGSALVIPLGTDFDESAYVKDYVSKCLS